MFLIIVQRSFRFLSQRFYYRQRNRALQLKLRLYGT